MRLMYPISNVKLQIENKIGRLNMGRKQKGSPKMQPPPKLHPVKRILEVLSRYLYNILYIALLAVLWRYIILNWEKCISMQFFSQFDGNNILFLVGIALVILPFYDIEGKGVKLHRRGTKATMEQLQELDLSYELEKRKESLGAVACEILEKSDGGGKQK